MALTRRTKCGDKYTLFVLGAFVPLVISFGCSDQSSPPSRNSLDLRGYQCISLKGVDIDPDLGLPGLPGQLTPYVQGELARSERWVYRGAAPQTTVVVGHHLVSGGSNQTPTSQPGTAVSSAPADEPPAVAIAVKITEVKLTSRMGRAFGDPRSMRCDVDVFEVQTGARLGTLAVKASSGPSVGKRMLAGVLVGAAAMRPAHDEESEKAEVLAATAKEIVQALEVARKTGG